MAANEVPRVWLDCQADQIERTLAGLSLPVRVNGGHVREGRVRYHLTPVGVTRLETLQGAEARVADALGALDVQVARETGGWALELEAEPSAGLRLLPLMAALGEQPALTAVVGMTEAGQPLTVSLDGSACRHLWIQALAGSGKSELLRSMLLSLAISSRPAEVQVLAVDIGGRQLACLEALPHAVTDLATEASFAVELLTWLRSEGERRTANGASQPRLLLVVDGLNRVPAANRAAFDRLLAECLTSPARAGLHIWLAADAGTTPASVGAGGRSDVCQIHAAGDVGRFAFHLGIERTVVEAAWLPLRELEAAVQLARRRPSDVARARLSHWVEPR